jgi:hypothetical protein
MRRFGGAIQKRDAEGPIYTTGRIGWAKGGRELFDTGLIIDRHSSNPQLSTAPVGTTPRSVYLTHRQ